MRCCAEGWQYAAQLITVIYDGVLGGFGYVPDFDISNSRALLQLVCGGTREPGSG